MDQHGPVMVGEDAEAYAASQSDELRSISAVF